MVHTWQGSSVDIVASHLDDENVFCMLGEVTGIDHACVTGANDSDEAPSGVCLALAILLAQYEGYHGLFLRRFVTDPCHWLIP